jgi:hypothetical protein
VPLCEIGPNRHSGNTAVISSVQNLIVVVWGKADIHEKISDNISCLFNIELWSKSTDSGCFFVTLATL